MISTRTRRDVTRRADQGSAAPPDADAAPPFATDPSTRGAAGCGADTGRPRRVSCVTPCNVGAQTRRQYTLEDPAKNTTIAAEVLEVQNTASRCYMEEHGTSITPPMCVR
jgi:hypothetical protein